jgi:hypothetical protein
MPCHSDDVIFIAFHYAMFSPPALAFVHLALILAMALFFVARITPFQLQPTPAASHAIFITPPPLVEPLFIRLIFVAASAISLRHAAACLFSAGWLCRQMPPDFDASDFAPRFSCRFNIFHATPSSRRYALRLFCRFFDFHHISLPPEAVVCLFDMPAMMPRIYRFTFERPPADAAAQHAHAAFSRRDADLRRFAAPASPPIGRR